MKRNFSVVLIGLDGDEFKNVKAQALTLGDLSATVLGSKYQGEQDLPGDALFKRYLLAERIHAGGVQDVTAEEVSLIKQLIARACEPRLLGPAYRALEQDVVQDGAA